MNKHEFYFKNRVQIHKLFITTYEFWKLNEFRFNGRGETNVCRCLERLDKCKRLMLHESTTIIPLATKSEVLK